MAERREQSAGRPKLDARPDTLDFRDRMYVPTLAEVPSRRDLDTYRAAGVPILDQGTEGACTGFGLATVVHYLLRTRQVDRDATDVSTRMLYEMAKRYDEWPGEGYSGSSARGAMKGWHKHGVCPAATWPYDPNDPDRRLTRERTASAADRPLGAYFRVNHRDIVAMHTALAEVGALYATARVHEGWWDPPADGIVPFRDRRIGGHAFAIVGYDAHGFWIQNSWGPGWGLEGFGRISYDDWLHNGSDVWVARLGVPVRLTRTTSVASVRSAGAGSRESYAVSELRPHIVSTGNDGRLRDTGPYGTTAEDLEHLFTVEMPQATAGWTRRRILLYAHGGLVDETSAVQRVAEYLPALLAHEIYPIAFVWKSDLWTTLKNVLEDALGRRRPEGFLDATKDFMLDRLDDALDPIARAVGGKLAWDEMKENARRATTSASGGARRVCELLDDFLRQDPKAEVHLVGHSAGSIYLAPIAQRLATSGPIEQGPMEGEQGLGHRVRTCTLWAPACTMDLYRQAYRPLVRSGAEGDGGIGRLAVFAMTDQAEQDDHCAHVYHKSLLYLVSNALEQTPRVPVFRPTGTPILGVAEHALDDRAFRKAVSSGAIDLVLSPNQAKPKSIDHSTAISHGGFDDDAPTVRATLARILGRKTMPAELTFNHSGSSMRDRRRTLA